MGSDVYEGTIIKTTTISIDCYHNVKNYAIVMHIKTMTPTYMFAGVLYATSLLFNVFGFCDPPLVLC